MSVSFTVLGTLSHKRQVQVDFPVNGLVYRVPWENVPNNPTSLQDAADIYEIGMKTEWPEWLTQPGLVGATIESQTLVREENGVGFYDLIISWPVNGATARVTIDVDVGSGMTMEEEDTAIQVASENAAYAWIAERPFYA